MHIPQWLLRLLPMWVHICPRCRKEVGKNSHQCPHCNEKYPMPLKIPPRILKDKEALEKYVHTHIFPRISKAYCEYLSNFFTVLFSDGFESGGFNSWSSTSGTPTVVGSPVHCGSYSAEFQQGDFITKTMDESTVFTRLYVRFSALPASTWQSNPFGRYRHSASPAADLVYFGIRQEASGEYGWVMISQKPSVLTSFYETTLSLDTWYCLEIKYVNDSVSGEYRMYVDGDEILSRTGVDTTEGGNVDTLYVGGWSTLADNLNVDCVVVADAYVGPEATLQAVTDAFSVSDVVLSHKTLSLFDSLGVDDAFYGDKTLFLSDSANLSTLVTVLIGEATKYVTDSVTVAELSKAMKNLKMPDTITLVDAASTPSRVLRALDAVGIAENSFVNKTLQINETVSIAEIVKVSTGGVKKTKLFLIIGDLAVQLTGD